MKHNLRSAVVGVGYLGRFHAAKHKELSTLGYVCDSSFERATEVANEFGCEAVRHPRDLIGKVQAVTVAADTRSHYELCRYFLENDVHVFVEKPICTNTQEAQAVVKLAEQRRLRLGVGHIERHNPAFVAAQSVIASPHFVHISRLAPFKPRSLNVDVVLDLMIHDLDLATTLMKSPLIDLRASGAKLITPYNDVCHAWVKFENGSEGYIECSRVDQRATRSAKVFDQAGLLEIDLGSQTVARKTHSAGPSESPLSVESVPVPKWDAMLRETDEFFRSIESGREPTVTGHQGMEALRWAEKVIELTR